MQPEAISTQNEIFTHQVIAGLPPERSQWPPSAQESFQLLLTDLNAWSRQAHHSFTGNQWIAESAVREVWSAESTQ